MGNKNNFVVSLINDHIRINSESIVEILKPFARIMLVMGLK